MKKVFKSLIFSLIMVLIPCMLMAGVTIDQKNGRLTASGYIRTDTTLDIKGGSFYTSFQGVSQSGNLVYYLPAAHAIGILINDGSGNLSWSSGTYQPLDGTLTALAGLTVTQGSLIYGTGTDAFSILAKSTAGTFLQTNTGATAPNWSAYSLPATIATGNILYASSSSILAALTTGTQYQILQMGATVPAWTSTFNVSAIDMTNATSSIPWPVGTATWPTTEGAAKWDSTNDALHIGDGATSIGLDFTAGATYTFPGATSTLLATTGTPAALVIASQATNDILYASSASAWARLGIGANGAFLMSNGVSTPPSWLAPGAANYVLVGAGTTTLPVWTASTGTGAPVLGTSPTFTTSITSPIVYTGVANTTAGNVTFYNATSGSISLQPATGALGTTVLTLPIGNQTLYGTASGSITSSQLITSLSDETGTGVAVFGTSPTFTTSVILPAAITSSAQATTWTGINNNASMLSFGSSGTANLLKLVSTTGSAGISVNGTVTTTAADGSNYISMGLNTTRAPGGAYWEIYPETATYITKVNQNNTEYSVAIGPTAGQVLFAGPSAPRTITLPDAAITVARTDAGQTFTGNQIFTGTVQGGIVVSSDADGMSAAEMTAAGVRGTLFIATGAGTWTLPTAAGGESLCLMSSGAAADLILDTTAGDTLRLKGTEGGDGKGATNAAAKAAGDFICVIAVAANKWSTVGLGGAWVIQP